MVAIRIFSPFGSIRTDLDSNTGLNELRVAPGFGIHAGIPYFSPGGAANGEQAALSLDPVHGWPVLTGGQAARDEVRRLTVSGQTRNAPYAGRSRPHGSRRTVERPRPYAGPARETRKGS